ncbi:MAG: phage protein GemA/Gp16 family protein [Desulfovibrionaceae bacterium]
MPDDNRRDLVTKAQIARKQLGLDKTTYYTLLAERYGVDSSTKLSAAQLVDLLGHFAARGWTAKPRRRKGKPAGGPTRKDVGWIQVDDSVQFARQKRLALALAKALGWNLAGLNTRIQRQFKIDDILWLNSQAALTTLINDMKQRCRRRGIDTE